MANDYAQVTEWSGVAASPGINYVPAMAYPLVKRADLALWHITGQMMAAGKDPETAASLAKRAVKAMYPGIETYSL